MLEENVSERKHKREEKNYARLCFLVEFFVNYQNNKENH